MQACSICEPAGYARSKEEVAVAQRDLCGPSANISESRMTTISIAMSSWASKQSDTRSAAFGSDQAEVCIRRMVVCS